ncbi:RNA polymerase sigma factor [Maribellus maritimus]|uniref:RNA polymerase sigma factor n=1 Tax=Maribellus maritimus TaxID=2870838 RepID=UPI001EEC0DCA|nr:RNA polymerase sigma-70 factor [Maribellus maritimus]MCG6187991.1 RNA polymerase sigma-70 factor [Maribellus maritimus]
MNQINNINDSELCERIKRGEKDAYRKLFEKYAPKIYHFSFTYLKNNDDAEELVQNVFIKIWEKRTTLDSTQNLKSFIFKIAVNTIYDLIRRKNIEHAFEDYARLNYETKENNTWHSVIFEEMKQHLHKLVAQLPEQQQKIFQLSKLEGLTNDEIAKTLNLSKRTVENHLYRALAFLKKHFKNESFVALLFFYLFCG